MKNKKSKKNNSAKGINFNIVYHKPNNYKTTVKFSKEERRIIFKS